LQLWHADLHVFALPMASVSVDVSARQFDEGKVYRESAGDLRERP
jgi:hypothetical protein